MKPLFKIFTVFLVLTSLLGHTQSYSYKRPVAVNRGAAVKSTTAGKEIKTTAGNAQNAVDSTTAKTLAVIYINKDVTTHFISPEPIQYVDISTNKVQGDLPVKTILRVKPTSESIPVGSSYVTIVGQKYFIQYRLVYTTPDKASTQVTINPENITPIAHPEYSLSTEDLYKFSIDILKKKASYHNVAAKAYGMQSRLNNIFTVGEYFFIDVEFLNHSKILYDVDQLRFKIKDKKITKSTNSQDVELKPVFMLYNTKNFKKRYRNVFVFHKFTFPDNKVFSIELSEKQISGRVIHLPIDYSDILNADQL